MFSKPWVKRTLIAVLVLIVFTAAGLAIYRVGYMRGALAASDGIPTRIFERFDFMDMHNEDGIMPFQDRGDAIFHNFMPGQFPSSRTVGYSGFVTPFSLLFRLLFFVGFLWVLYSIFRTIFRGAGWQLTFTKTPDPIISPGEELNQQ
jgi:hypothetical protein